jgi:hypothetical protein
MSEPFSDELNDFFLSILSMGGITDTKQIKLDNDKIFKLITHPDFDIKKISNLVIANIGTFRKQIPHCDRAFDIIQNSVNLLETNFANYCKKEKDSKNMYRILEWFFIDLKAQKMTIADLYQIQQVGMKLQEDMNLQEIGLGNFHNMNTEHLNNAFVINMKKRRRCCCCSWSLW